MLISIFIEVCTILQIILRSALSGRNPTNQLKSVKSLYFFHKDLFDLLRFERFDFHFVRRPLVLAEATQKDDSMNNY